MFGTSNSFKSDNFIFYLLLALFVWLPLPMGSNRYGKKNPKIVTAKDDLDKAILKNIAGIILNYLDFNKQKNTLIVIIVIMVTIKLSLII